MEKLDLTVNFVNDLLSVESLQGNIHLKQLYDIDIYLLSIQSPLIRSLKFLLDRYLVGNPCTEIEGYRHFVIATLPQLETLDGKDIEKSERIAALQEYKAIRERLVGAAVEDSTSATTNTSQEEEECVEGAQVVSGKEIQSGSSDKSDLEKTRQDFQTKAVKHTPESRLQTAKELELLRAKQDNKLEKKKVVRCKVWLPFSANPFSCMLLGTEKSILCG